MCELLSMSFDGPVSADVNVDTFAAADVDNADGWGMAWYVGRSLALVKEPIRWRLSPYAEFLRGYEHVRSPLFIAHVRHATVGGPPVRADCHPFGRELFGRAYCFAHNGTVYGAREELPLGHYHPIGATDSEHTFCHLLDRIVRRGRPLEDEEDFRWLHRVLTAINQRGKLNCLFTDGRRLLCYRDRVWTKGLHMRSVVVNNHRVRRMEDRTIQVDLHDDKARRGIIVATRPLDDEPWHALRGSELVVVRDGRLEFSSARSGAVAG
jgi:glutamine amidotransferase